MEHFQRMQFGFNIQTARIEIVFCYKYRSNIAFKYACQCRSIDKLYKTSTSMRHVYHNSQRAHVPHGTMHLHSLHSIAFYLGSNKLQMQTICSFKKSASPHFKSPLYIYRRHANIITFGRGLQSRMFMRLRSNKVSR